MKSPLLLAFFHATVTIGRHLGQLLPKTFVLLLRELDAGRWGGGNENSEK